MIEKRKMLMKAIAEGKEIGEIVSLINDLTNNGKKSRELDFTDDTGRFRSQTNIPLDTPLMMAVFRGNLGVVRELINRGADINKSNKWGTPLMLAADMGYLEITKELLDANERINIENNGNGLVLMLGAAAILEYINKRQPVTGSTALIRAVLEGHLLVIKELLDRGAEIDKQNNFGATPLMLAILKGKSEIANELLIRRPEIDRKNKNGETALMYAADFHKLDIVTTLLNNGANVNAVNNKGETVLMKAVKSVSYGGPLEIVKKILDSGADIDKKDNSGTTVMDIAKKIAQRTHNWEVVNYLTHEIEIRKRKRREDGPERQERPRKKKREDDGKEKGREMDMS